MGNLNNLLISLFVYVDLFIQNKYYIAFWELKHKPRLARLTGLLLSTTKEMLDYNKQEGVKSKTIYQYKVFDLKH